MARPTTTSLDLSSVQAFVKVAEVGSFTRAALTLGVPTSSVSRAVARLEAHLGVRLLERTTRRTALTSAGRTFAADATQALAALQDAERHMAESRRDPHGEVRLTAPGDLDDGFLASAMVAFTRRHPRVQVVCTFTNRMVDLISEGVDLALRVADGLPDSSLVARPLGRYRAPLVASAAYVADHGTPATPAGLAHHPCVLTHAHRGRATWVLHGPGGPHRVEVTGSVVADDLRVVRQLVEAGAGIGVLPRAPGAAEAVLGSLVRVLPAYTLDAPTLYLVAASSRRLAPQVALFRQHLLAAYATARRPSAAPA